MKFEEAAAGLAHLPSRLPPAPRALTPTIVPGAGGAAGAVPSFPELPMRQAAVLVLVYPDVEGEAVVVLTERSSGGHRHAGQISLPGGAIDAGETVVDAALREAREEVGLDADADGVAVLGEFEPVELRVSGFHIHAVAATARRRPRLVPDGREVAALIEAPLAAFLPDAAIEIVTAERDGMTLRYGAFPVSGHRVWGATARILGGVGVILARAEAR